MTAGLQTTWNDGSTVGDRHRGLFRVWSSKLDDPQASPRALWKKDYPLTAAARRKLAAWDAVIDTLARVAMPKGMPTIMEEPYPIEFVPQGEPILLRLEEYDTIRTIDMKNTSVAPRSRTLLGHSRGRCEGRTLVVTTTHIDWPNLDPSGVPLGPTATLIERFTPNEAGTWLEYTLLVSDVGTFTQPIELTRKWVWRAGESVEPYGCRER